MVNIGSNIFLNCTIPIILGDRYFILEYEDNCDKFTVFWLEDDRIVYEILKNNFIDNPNTCAEMHKSGIITVVDKSTNRFLYKIRLGSKNSIIFGRIKDKEEEIIIKDKKIMYRGNVFEGNIFMGIPVGIHIKSDGSLAIGARLPNQLINIISRSEK